MIPKVNFSLKKVLIDKGITQRELSKSVGMPEWKISMVTNGKLNIYLDEQIRLANALQVNRTDIFED